MRDEPTSAVKPLVLKTGEAKCQPLLTGRPQTHGMRCGAVALEPGGECGEHTTKGHEETLVFLRGAGTVRLGGHEPLAVGAGRVAYIPPHTVHNVVNTGVERLCYIYVVAPVHDGAGASRATEE